MQQIPDDPPNPPLDAEPPADTADIAPPEAPAAAALSDAPPRRRRRRRRRKPPATAAPSAADAGAAEPIAPEAGAALESETEAAPAPQDRPHRRRRRVPRPGAAGEAAASAEATAPASPEAETARRQAEAARRRLKVVEIRSPWGRRTRNRQSPEAGAGDSRPQGTAGEPPAAEPQFRDRRRAGGPGRDANRDGRGRSAGPRPRGRGAKDRPQSRNAPPKRIEQKLYATRAVVDHGFEDVEEPDDNGAARRVTWTIVKRTLVDQTAGRPKSAVYVLERDGAETEFPNLGAARAAVNKTIVHPERLTRSKAEHAAERAKK